MTGQLKTCTTILILCTFIYSTSAFGAWQWAVGKTEELQQSIINYSTCMLTAGTFPAFDSNTAEGRRLENLRSNMDRLAHCTKWNIAICGPTYYTKASHQLMMLLLEKPSLISDLAASPFKCAFRMICQMLPNYPIVNCVDGNLVPQSSNWPQRNYSAYDGFDFGYNPPSFADYSNNPAPFVPALGLQQPSQPRAPSNGYSYSNPYNNAPYDAGQSYHNTPAVPQNPSLPHLYPSSPSNSYPSFPQQSYPMVPDLSSHYSPSGHPRSPQQSAIFPDSDPHKSQNLMRPQPSLASHNFPPPRQDVPFGPESNFQKPNQLADFLASYPDYDESPNLNRPQPSIDSPHFPPPTHDLPFGPHDNKQNPVLPPVNPSPSPSPYYGPEGTEGNADLKSLPSQNDPEDLGHMKKPSSGEVHSPFVEGGSVFSMDSSEKLHEPKTDEKGS